MHFIVVFLANNFLHTLWLSIFNDRKKTKTKWYFRNHSGFGLGCRPKATRTIVVIDGSYYNISTGIHVLNKLVSFFVDYLIMVIYIGYILLTPSSPCKYFFPCKITLLHPQPPIPPLKAAFKAPQRSKRVKSQDKCLNDKNYCVFVFSSKKKKKTHASR